MTPRSEIGEPSCRCLCRDQLANFEHCRVKIQMKCLLGVLTLSTPLPLVVFVIHPAPNHPEDHQEDEQHHGDDELGPGGDGVNVGRGDRVLCGAEGKRNIKYNVCLSGIELTPILFSEIWIS